MSIKEMIQALESRFRVKECSFNSIFGTFEGHRIYASMKVAEKIEIQTRYAAELYNVMSGRINDIWPRKTCHGSNSKTTRFCTPNRGFGIELPANQTHDYYLRIGYLLIG